MSKASIFNCTKRLFSFISKDSSVLSTGTVCLLKKAIHCGYTKPVQNQQAWGAVSVCESVMKRFFTDCHRDAKASSNLESTAMWESTQYPQETVAVDSETENDQTRPNSSPVFNIDLLVTLLRQENAKDICVIKVPEEMKYTDYFVVVSGSSARHLSAMAHYAIKVYKHIKREGDPHVQIEGKDAEDWVCIDFGNIVVHFMLPETREIYELEKLWTLGSYDDQLAMISPETLPEDFIYGPVVDSEPVK
ncbi:mitochondrial assembly of ribosomal large subunit protein 1 [Acipenser oxyrinchus oxyrinchus]|uniref:Mitochondrial assembly of ribosomal large subunit protein 1 n=1 Tax=Acipenser oxyrinchus oxyrinchus TaxID=40147 RepID=A0AAD8GEF3_ACIOX|nr:mitochondrial assembly of ribosomal large subunit protein 1 [Acipenser oxyrinchus oxyrinchus]